MTFELRFFTACDHKVKSEPLILDENGVGTTSVPIERGITQIVEQNIRVIREPVIRSANEVDALQQPIVTNIDLIVQEVLHNGIMEIRKYKPNRDFILSGDRFILWRDSAEIYPNLGEMYFVTYRRSRVLPKIYNRLDAQRAKLSSYNPDNTYLIDYYTKRDFCTKCIKADTLDGQEVMRDITYSPTGDFARIEGVEKLKQDMIRAILAIRGSNPFIPNYGTQVEASIGTAAHTDIFGALLKQEIKQSLQLLQSFQILQEDSQVVDPAEILDSILEIKLLSDRNKAGDFFTLNQRTDDPTKYHLIVTVRSRANNMVEFFIPLDVFSKQSDTTDVPIIEIRNFEFKTIGKDQLGIYWETNIETDTIIDYGEGEILGSRELGSPGIRHFVGLTSLKPDTLYNLKVVTRNRGFIYGSEIKTVKTLP